MGQMVSADLMKQSDISILAGVERDGHTDINSTCDGLKIITDSSQIPEADVWIDFSLAEAATRHAEMATKTNMHMIIGATGFNNEQLQILINASKYCPLLLGSNFSMGVGVMQHIVGITSKWLKNDFDTTLSEQHHKKKLDKPSGTAKDLLKTIYKSSQLTPQIASFRVGGAIGEHQVRFVGEHEELVITHRAFSREAFSQGVKIAIDYIVEQKNGFYSVSDIYSANLPE